MNGGFVSPRRLTARNEAAKQDVIDPLGTNESSTNNLLNGSFRDEQIELEGCKPGPGLRDTDQANIAKSSRGRRKKSRRSNSSSLFMDYISELNVEELFAREAVAFPGILYEHYDFELERKILNLSIQEM